MSLHETAVRLARPFRFAALLAFLSACAQQDVEDREASLGVVRSFSDEPGTRPREAPAGTGSIPDVPLNVPPHPQPESPVLWTPEPQEGE